MTAPTTSAAAHIANCFVDWFISLRLEFPQIESLKKMIPESELWPISDTWNYHCTASSSAMNNMNMLTEAVNRHYGEASSLEEYVKKAHAVDYNGTGGMFAAFRVRMPLATGIVQWMLNSAWPSMYWQLYDWYGVPTAGYYGTKKACEPMQLLFNYLGQLSPFLLRYRG